MTTRFAGYAAEMLTQQIYFFFFFNYSLMGVLA